MNDKAERMRRAMADHTQFMAILRERHSLTRFDCWRVVVAFANQDMGGVWARTALRDKQGGSDGE